MTAPIDAPPLDLRALAYEYLHVVATDWQDDRRILLALLERVEAATLERAAERVAQYPDLDERSAAYAARCIRAMTRNDGKG